jgi:hypothetical protein
MTIANKVVYRAKLASMLGGLTVMVIIFFGLTLPEVGAGIPLVQEQLNGLIGFWIIGIVITITPLGFKVEVEGDIVRAYFIIVLLKELRPSDVQSVTYGNLFSFGS